MNSKEEKTIVLVRNIETLEQKESLTRHYEKQNTRDVLTLSIPKSVIQREVIRLGNLQREAIIKFFWENLDIPKIAYRMKLRPKSVQKLIETALATIRRRLTSEEGNSSS